MAAIRVPRTLDPPPGARLWTWKVPGARRRWYIHDATGLWRVTSRGAKLTRRSSASVDTPGGYSYQTDWEEIVQRALRMRDGL